MVRCVTLAVSLIVALSGRQSSAEPVEWKTLAWKDSGEAPGLTADSEGTTHLAWIRKGSLVYGTLASGADAVSSESPAEWPGAGNGWNFGPDLAVDASGIVRIVWASPVGGDKYVVWLVRKSAEGWDPPVEVQAASLRGYAPRLALDAAGVGVAVLAAGDNVPFGWVNHHQLGVGAVSQSQPNVAPARVDDRLAMTAGSTSGARHLLVGLPNPAGDVLYRHSDDAGSTWLDGGSVQSPACGGRVGQPDVALADDGLHLVYGCGSDAEADGAPSVRHLRMKDGAWGVDTLVSNPGELSGWHLDLGIGRIATRADGTLLTIYLSNDAGVLRARRSDDGGKSWLTPQKLADVAGGAEGRNAPAVVAVGETFVVAYSDGKTLHLALGALAPVCLPDCGGKACGGDGCGGGCGQCADGEECSVTGQCEAPPPPVLPPVVALRVPGFPDGDASEWADVEAHVLSAPEAWVSLGAAVPTGPADLELRFKIGWETDRLRLLITVIDDVHAPNAAPGLLWQGDSVQVALDPGHEQTVGKYGPKDWEIGVAEHEGAVLTDCYVSPQAGCEVVAALASGEAGRTFEVDIPVPAAAGATMGVSVLANEDDGAGREGWLEWTPGVGKTKDPSRFWPVTFSGDAVDPPGEDVQPPGEDVQPPEPAAGDPGMSEDVGGLSEAEADVPPDSAGTDADDEQDSGGGCAVGAGAPGPPPWVCLPILVACLTLGTRRRAATQPRG